MPVSENRSRMSLRRHGALLRKYSLIPERNTRREIVTSENSVGRMPRSFLNVRCTSARLSGLRDGHPLKITSSIESPRNCFALCSPITQRMASETLVLPQPFGPMTPVMPSPKDSEVLSTNDLNPWSSSRFRNIRVPSRVLPAGSRTAGATEIARCRDVGVVRVARALSQWRTGDPRRGHSAVKMHNPCVLTDPRVRASAVLPVTREVSGRARGGQ